MNHNSVKICGTTSLEDLLLAQQAGADQFGVIVHPSWQTRYTVDVATAAFTRAAHFGFLQLRIAGGQEGRSHAAV